MCLSLKKKETEKTLDWQKRYSCLFLIRTIYLQAFTPTLSTSLISHNKGLPKLLLVQHLIRQMFCDKVNHLTFFGRAVVLRKKNNNNKKWSAGYFSLQPFDNIVSAFQHLTYRFIKIYYIWIQSLFICKILRKEPQ